MHKDKIFAIINKIIDKLFKLIPGKENVEMKKQNIAVIYGGCSPEHEVSIMSAVSIISNLSEEQYTIIPIYITKEGQWLMYDGRVDNIKNIQWEKFGTPAILSPDRTHGGLLRIIDGKVKTIPVDIAFPVLHGKNGEDGTIQGLLELSGIPYVGCGTKASSIAMDKAVTKVIADSLKINQAPFYVYPAYQYKKEPEEILKKIRYKIGYPCFIKPANTGSSVGISKAGNKKELEAAISLAFKYDDKFIVEKAVKGRELECSVLGRAPDTIAGAVGEILSAKEFYDYEAKYLNPDSKTIVPADLPQDIYDEIRRISIDIFNGIGGFGLSRVDFFLEEETNKIIFNEINTMPGFTSISMYPMLMKEAGVNFPEVLDRLIEMALERGNK